MKNIYTSILFLALLSLFACRFSTRNGSQTINIANNASGYSFEAIYPESKTKKVQTYMSEALKNDLIYKSESSKTDADMSVGDSLFFHLKAEPGYLKIKFKKQQNSYTAYKRLEDICIGIKEVLK